MEFFSQITCGHCNKSHRIRKSLRTRARYRFRCKRCGSMVVFKLDSVRWAYEPAAAASDMLQTLAGTPTGSDERQLRVQLQPVRIPAIPPPLPVEAIKPAPVLRDTLMDQRPPIHLSPLHMRGVHRERESSRVRWLRQRQ